MNPSAGSGSVISVSLTVDPSLTGLFTNTGASTVTTTGTFTLTQAASPTISVSSANAFTTTSSSSTTGVVSFKSFNSVATTFTPVRWGRDDGNGNSANLSFTYNGYAHG